MLFVLGDITEREVKWEIFDERHYIERTGTQAVKQQEEAFETRDGEIRTPLSHNSLAILSFFSSHLSPIFSWDQLQVLAAEKWRNSANWNFWFFFLNFPEAVILHNEVVMKFFAFFAVKFSHDVLSAAWLLFFYLACLFWQKLSVVFTNCL